MTTLNKRVFNVYIAVALLSEKSSELRLGSKL